MALGTSASPPAVAVAVAVRCNDSRAAAVRQREEVAMESGADAEFSEFICTADGPGWSGSAMG